MKEFLHGRRAAVAAAAALLSITLAGCSGSGTRSVDGADGNAGVGGGATITVSYSTDIESWNPYAHSSTPSYSRWGNMLEPLVTFDYQTRKFVPVLATSWEAKDTTWTFHLRTGVKFHSGAPFTSADVVHSFDRIMKEPESLQGGDLKVVSSIKAPDDQTVVVTTKEPSATLLSSLISRYITSKTTFDKYGAKEADHHPDGTGPYQFVRWQPGVDLTVKRFPGYWGQAPSTAPQTIIFRLIASPEDAVAALERGEVDIATGLPIQDVDQVNSGGKAHMEKIDGARTLMFPFNSSRAPFNNAQLRQALSYAVDVKGIIGTILKDAATPMNGVVPRHIYGADDSIKPYEYNPERAKQILADAGLKGTHIKLSTPTNRYPKDVEVAQAIQQQLQVVGLEVEIATPEFGTLSADMTAGKLDFYQISRGNYVDAAVLLAQYFQTGVTKRTGYSNPEVDKLLDEQAKELDETKRLALLAKAQELIHADAPAIFFGSYTDIYGVSNRVTWKPGIDESVAGAEISVSK